MAGVSDVRIGTRLLEKDGITGYFIQAGYNERSIFRHIGSEISCVILFFSVYIK